MRSPRVPPTRRGIFPIPSPRLPARLPARLPGGLALNTRHPRPDSSRLAWPSDPSPQALFNIEEDATVSFRKLNFLVENPPFPAPTFSNLLLLYCKFNYYDLAADVLARAGRAGD